MSNALFDPERTEAEIVNELVKMRFVKIGEGHSARVFCDTDNQIVLKVFPALNVGASSELDFIQRNPILSIANQFTLRWENVRIVNYARQRAKSFVSVILSQMNCEDRQYASDYCIRGYEACIEKGLMTRLPTRAISNCMSQLSLNGCGWTKKYLLSPAKIIMQERFHDGDVVINALLSICVKNDPAERCFELIEKAIEYQLMMWRLGLICTDSSFNILDNLIVSSDGELQVHDANDVRVSIESAIQFIRRKEQDLHHVFSRLVDREYPRLLFDTTFGSIAHSARKLYNLLPSDYRDVLVMHFLELSRKTLCEDIFLKNWKIS